MKPKSQRENINKYDSKNVQREVITLRFERQMTHPEGINPS